MKKKVILVSCFNNYQIRLKHIEEYFKSKSYEVTYITSDFNHATKEYYRVDYPGTQQIHAISYKRNLSIRRMVSHFVWSMSVYRRIKQLKPSFVYVMLPPNSLARYAVRYRRKSKVKLAFDIYDLWPETYPYNEKALMLFPFYFWKRMRDKYLGQADVVMFECDLFRTIISPSIPTVPTGTLYPALDIDTLVERENYWVEDVVHLAFLGTANNIIDIQTIANLIRRINSYKSVHLHIIGIGEKMETLVEAVLHEGANVSEYGAVYNSDQKQSILNQCRFGLNFMRATVCVGLTMKSIDYLRSGLPILNNIPGDTSMLVDNFGIGYNNNDIEELARLVAFTTRDENDRLRESAFRAYCQFFSPESFLTTLRRVFDEKV